MNGLVPLIFFIASLLATLFYLRHFFLVGLQPGTVLQPSSNPDYTGPVPSTVDSPKRGSQTIAEAENEVILEVAREENPELDQEEFEGTPPFQELDGETKESAIFFAFKSLGRTKKEAFMFFSSLTLVGLLIWRFLSERELGVEGYPWLACMIGTWVSGPSFFQVMVLSKS